MASSPSSLSPEQLRALFDILNHHETYREAQSFKYNDAIREYGYPFSDAKELSSKAQSYHAKSSSPLLQLLLTKLILTVPGMNDLPPDFWPYNVQAIMIKLADANLSESYDKGTLGTRKTLATGASVIHEALTRGLLGGVPRDASTIPFKQRTYDTTQASELERAWDECVHELIHADLANELFDHFMKTADFESHSPAVAAATEYGVMHLASLLHHVFVLNPEGQYLLKLIENVFKLVPFSMIRQTLRIGNAATMIHGMMRVFLAKMSMGAMTNWMGLTSGADDGMNLLHKIISMVLSWDSTDFRKQASQIETAKERPTKEQIAALKAHLSMPAGAHRATREISMAQEKSIVAVIFEATDPKLMDTLTESQHGQCLEWYSAMFSARDRDEITAVLCKSNPDYLTAAVRGMVETYEPYIRVIHESMDLREHVTAVENFFSDFIETSKPKKTKSGSSWIRKSAKTKAEDSRPPSVEDYVALIRRNKGMLYNYFHQFAIKCTDLREQFRGWANYAVDEFNARHDDTGHEGIGERLQDIYAALPEDSRESVLSKLDAHASYLSKLDTLSRLRMQRVLDQLENQTTDDDKSSKSSKKSSRPSSKSSSNSSHSSIGGPSMSGPGVYLIRWDSLLDETVMTPDKPHGPVRHGKDVRGLKTMGKTISGSIMGGWDAGAIAREEDRVIPEAPNAKLVTDLLEDQFREIVNDRIGDVAPALSEKVGQFVDADEVAKGLQAVQLVG